MVQYLKYVSFRLFFVILLFFPTIYLFQALDFIEYSRSFDGNEKLFILLIFFLLFLVSSFTLDVIVSQSINHRLEGVKEKREIKLREALAHFESLYSITFSAFFPKNSGGTVRKKVIARFADLLTAD